MLTGKASSNVSYWRRNGIQLFRQRLSHESLKAYATMPIGIMGSKSLALLDRGSRRFSNKERERMNTCLCCFLSPRWITSRFTQVSVKTTITHNNFRHCRVSFSPFVRQPFSKQLYTAVNSVIQLQRPHRPHTWTGNVSVLVNDKNTR